MPQGVNYSAKWADFLADLRFSELSTDTVHRMKRSLLDYIGVTVAGSRNRSCRLLFAYAKSQGGAQQSTIIPDGLKTTSSSAAMVNGSFAHSTEMAELFLRAAMHTGTMVPPAAVAVAENVGANGRELIEAMVGGHEIAIRAGLAVRIERDSPTFAAKEETRPHSSRFVHGVATYGLYGAAAAAAKLLQLDKPKTANALRICSSLTPAIGLEAATRQGAMVKDLMQGFGVSVGVLAAELASEGFTGVEDVTTHFASLVPDYEPSVLVEGLGSKYLIGSGGLGFKLHCTAGMTISVAEAMLDALAKRKMNRSEVDAVEVYTNMRGVRLCSDADPRTPVAAHSSIPYVVSALLTYPESVESDPRFLELYTDEKIQNEERLELARKVEVKGSPDFEKGFERDWPLRFPAEVRIRLKTGERVVGITEAWGICSNLTDDQLVQKFNDSTLRVLPPDKRSLVVERSFGVDSLGKVDELVRAACI